MKMSRQVKPNFTHLIKPFGLFNLHIKILLPNGLKHCTWPSADVKSMQNDPGRAMHWQCMFPLSLCKQLSLKSSNSELSHP